ncbi:MAG: glucose-1-phosphate adenylyltransferase subunit GlgD [Clostridia bacterium]
MLDTMGIIFAQSEGIRLGELTRERSLSALPVAGRYRLIDFILSNMVNSGISNVGVTTSYNFQSLMDHVGGGLPWDLGRKKYGLFILPPFYKQNDKVLSAGDNKIEILHGIMHYIKRSRQRYVLLADSNVVCNMTFDEMMNLHQENRADITVVYNELAENEVRSPNDVYLETDDKNRITKIEPYSSITTLKKRAIGFYLMDCDLLENIVENCMARGNIDLIKDSLMKNTAKLKIMGYKYDGYVKIINDINGFYNFNMDLLTADVRAELFEAKDKIYTKVKDRVPARYLEDSNVKNSFIADGCIINGEVEGSILFRGVEIQKGCSVKNCVIMQDSKIMENSKVNHIIMDKQVIIDRNKNLCGDASFPIVIGKNRRIY